MEIKQNKKIAVLIGATGLVGGSLLDLLISHEDYSKVIVIARKSYTGISSDKVDWNVNDFTDPDTYRDLIKGDDLFVTLGTTMAKAGSKESFVKVDRDLVLQIARYGQMNGINQLSLVTAVGANPDSVFFYNRVKGELEKQIMELPFRAFHIFQPSMLLGDRLESRPLEAVGQRVFRWVNSFFGSKLGKYQAVHASGVAKAMVYFAGKMDPGIHFHPSHEIATFDREKSIAQINN
jgi:uncharacterized protein YbjT (DUF2867 family)